LIKNNTKHANTSTAFNTPKEGTNPKKRVNCPETTRARLKEIIRPKMNKVD